MRSHHARVPGPEESARRIGDEVEDDRHVVRGSAFLPEFGPVGTPEDT
jgi:hypothetical protein